MGGDSIWQHRSRILQNVRPKSTNSQAEMGFPSDGSSGSRLVQPSALSRHGPRSSILSSHQTIGSHQIHERILQTSRRAENGRQQLIANTANSSQINEQCNEELACDKDFTAGAHC